MISHPLTRAMGLVVDTGEKLTRAMAHDLYAAGVRAVGRYVFFNEPRPGDLDAAELVDCTEEGLVVWVVQHPRLPEYNTLSAELGKTDADWAVTNCLAARYDPALIEGPPVSLVCDMEGVRNPGPDSVAYSSTWTDVALLGAGGYSFGACTYIGYACGLAGTDCDALPPQVGFWCDNGPLHLRPAPKRGYVLKQGESRRIAGVLVDLNVVQQDNVIFGAAAGP